MNSTVIQKPAVSNTKLKPKKTQKQLIPVTMKTKTPVSVDSEWKYDKEGPFGGKVYSRVGKDGVTEYKTVNATEVEDSQAGAKAQENRWARQKRQKRLDSEAMIIKKQKIQDRYTDYSAKLMREFPEHYAVLKDNGLDKPSLMASVYYNYKNNPLFQDVNPAGLITSIGAGGQVARAIRDAGDKLMRFN